MRKGMLAISTIAALLLGSLTACGAVEREQQEQAHRVEVDLKATIPACATKPDTDCYDRAHMRDWLVRAAGAIQAKYSAKQPDNVVFLADGQTVDTNCAASKDSDEKVVAGTNLFSFCNGVIYVGQARLWKLYNTAEIVALVQLTSQYNSLSLKLRPSTAEIRRADCQTGANIRDMRSTRTTAVQRQVDTAGLTKLSTWISSESRRANFNIGLKLGAEACK